MMTLPQQIAKQLRDVYFGGNWTAVCLQRQLADVDWQQATREIAGMHAIATLVFHMNYYVQATIRVLEGGPLDAKDSLSFDHPPIRSESDWQQLLDKSWDDARTLAENIEQLPEARLAEPFVSEKYGTYFRCLTGPIEHCHYHLGQIVAIKKYAMRASGE